MVSASTKAINFVRGRSFTSSKKKSSDKLVESPKSPRSSKAAADEIEKTPLQTEVNTNVPERAPEIVASAGAEAEVIVASVGEAQAEVIVATAEVPALDEDSAATKLQSGARGHAARNELAEVKAFEEVYAKNSSGQTGEGVLPAEPVIPFASKKGGSRSRWGLVLLIVAIAALFGPSPPGWSTPEAAPVVEQRPVHPALREVQKALGPVKGLRDSLRSNVDTLRGHVDTLRSRVLSK